MSDKPLYGHRPPLKPRGDVWWGESIVTDEVREALAAAEVEGPNQPIPVILELVWDKPMEDLARLVKEEAGIEVPQESRTDRFLQVQLNAEQVEALRRREEANRRATGQPSALFKIWSDKSFRPQAAYLPGLDEACLREFKNLACIKALAAQRVFGAVGQGINWAVIDTGIDIHHPWWKDQGWDDHNNRDFSTEGTTEDLVGHGTHIAGIIKLIAPEVKLYNFKALSAVGGSSFSIIRALYHVRVFNLRAGHTKIQGVNLSLGGPVPVKSYGCGWSPECQEANALVNSGVTVCAAASNDGYKILATINQENDLEYFPTYMSLGISDPGNAEDVITVGSTHSEFPHRYGPSYFSSRGPTGDGRFKPDVLAPGERISSAWPATEDLVPLSGTSMATAHVSGVVAQFLSVKPEFISLPRQVKQRLMASCTDLDRDRNFQGAGLIDALAFLQSC